jgi:glycosyltransferase involved in cell wall biosynthesis
MQSDDIKFSLVMCTVNRPREVERFVEALQSQTYKNFELIIVDQNADECIAPIVARFKDKMDIRHLRSALGCSRSRNVGMRAMTGDVLAFPDDDSIYPTTLLHDIRSLLIAHPEWDGLTTSIVGDKHWSTRPGLITRYRLWWQGVDFTQFLRKRMVDLVGPLDERLGPGAGTPWGAGEGADYLLRCLARGFTLYYEPSIKVEHPGPMENQAVMSKEIRKALVYSRGVGHVIRTHGYPAWYAGYMTARPLAGATLSLLKFNPQRAMLYWNVMRGLMLGYLSNQS